ncbi:fucose isomerase [Agrococcus casei]|uniref:fucose isomerase n=1 Tax=Agrococcus casei TaxID=343512 RepID=UPI003F90AFCE
MTNYAFPKAYEEPQATENTIYTVASGDLRLSANEAGWETQRAFEERVGEVLTERGWSVQRAHEVDPATGHGFIDTQRKGIEVFKRIPKDAPIVIVDAVWQYSHHVVAGLRKHRGPVLAVANWAGGFPGLVGLLNMTASLTKANIDHSILWSKDFTDEWALGKVDEWLKTGTIVHDTSHVRDLPELGDSEEAKLGRAIAQQLSDEQALIGIFDEGCMGMYNAIIDDEMLNPTGIYKERLSQSALLAEMAKVAEDERESALQWLEERGMTFHWGDNPAEDLTRDQVLEQMAMYIAALRIADDYGLDAVGIQYQQGLKDQCAASDLAEGLLNNVERPAVFSRDGSRELFAGEAMPHFNEVDEGVAVDALVTNRVWKAMGLDPANTLHDIRWGEEYDGDFVWVFEISGAVPASHNGGYDKSYSMRQVPWFFPHGGGTLAGVSKPGEIVFSRVFIMNDELHADIGRAHVVELPEEETQRRLNETDKQWPIMHAVLHGITRDQMMARHKANHLQVAYADDADSADRALAAKAAAFAGMGIRVHLVGDVAL